MSTYENSTVRVISCAMLVENSTLSGEDERLSSQPFSRERCLDRRVGRYALWLFNLNY